MKIKEKVKVSTDEILDYCKKTGFTKGVSLNIGENAADAIRRLIPRAANNDEYLRIVEIAGDEAWESMHYNFEVQIRIEDGPEIILLEPADFDWYIENEVTLVSKLPVKLHPGEISF